LERAEALLRTIFNESELAKLLSQNLAQEKLPESDIGGPANLRHGGLNANGPRMNAEALPSMPRSDDFNFSTPMTQTASLGRFQLDKSAPVSTTSPTSAFSSPEDASVLHDSLPSAADDEFEWDERESRWTSYESGPKASSLLSSDEATIRKITDGMATLTANNGNTGFLGPVSGAALLRFISENSASDRPFLEAGDGRRNSLADQLAQDSADRSSAGSWLQAQPILTRAVVDTLVDAYFAHYHLTFPILHEPTFRQHYQSLHERPKGTWHTLANLVAALGSFVSSKSSDDTDINLFNSVKSYLTIDALEAGSLGLVQAFAMAANYLQKRNRPNSGYNYGGVALRLAISLGLHKEFEGWKAAPLKKEIRRRVWWSLCVLDVGATITYGRPLNWPQAGVEALFPLNINEQVSGSFTPSCQA
jgi:transcriptional regulatory protein GAL4